MRPLTDDPNPPASPVKLVFIHHSSGENWLADEDGRLGMALRDNNYFVSDTNYGWGPEGIGDRTDLGHWWDWFRGPDSATYLAALYSESGQHAYYSRLPTDPGGENEIVMFKSCFPNSHLAGSTADPPTAGHNPLRGQDAWSEHMTVGNAKGIYNDILDYFASRQDKLFVVITAPPLGQNDTDAAHAANARAFNNWLVNDWLDSYPHRNVAVFDFYNVLTSNGGNASTNDAGQESGNHHRWWNGAVQYVQTMSNNYAAYPTDAWDSHPAAAGNQKAADEFLPLLNVFYHRWQSSAGMPMPTATAETPAATPTATATSAPSTPTMPTPRPTSAPPTPVPPTPTAAGPLPSGQYTIVFQQGVSPDPSYAGMTDAILANDVAANANVGAAENLETFFGEAEYRRSLMRWDLSALPVDITVNAATLELYRYDGDPANTMELTLHRVTGNWTEGTGWDFWPDASYVPDGATWLTTDGSTAWTDPGGDHDPAVLDQITLPMGMGNGWIRLDVTAAVSAWVGGMPNHGLLLRPQSGDYTYHYYYSRDHGAANLRPRLVVTYTVGVAAAPTPTATAALAEMPTPDDWPYLPLILKGWPAKNPAPLPTATPESGGLNVPLTVQETAGVARTAQPVTSGVPIPRSQNLTNLSDLRLLDPNGDPVPAQFTPLARWGGAPDDASKPVRWLLLDFQADVPANGTATYRLVDGGGAMPAYSVLTVTDGPDAITVDTGAATFSLSKADGRLTAPLLSAPLSGQAMDAGGAAYTTVGPVAVSVVLSGPMRASVHVKGAYRDARGTALLDYTSRYWFYAGQPFARLFHTLENNTPCPLVEYAQLDCYDIGSPGSVAVADVSLVLPTALSGSLTYSVGGDVGAADRPPVSDNLTGDLLLYQDSSGTDHWDRYPTMTDWGGNPLNAEPRMQSFVEFRGYRTELGGAVLDNGNHAAGWLSIGGENGAWTAGMHDFWQNFPKSLRAAPDGRLEIGLFPDEFGPSDYSFVLRAGEHKTHEILLSPSLTPPHPHPLFAQAPAEWYVGSAALGLTALPNWTDWPDHEQYIDHQLSTSPDHWLDDYFENLLDTIDSTDFYGIFDYGDWPLDYEGYEVAPMNAKYDNNYGLWLQWARGGNLDWFRLAEAANRHLADVDILHNLHNPRHWGDGIAFGHSYHDEEGFVNPHRNYGGNHPDTAFGVTGLLLTYYLTDYEKAAESALELADCIEYRLHNDAHLCNSFPSGECSGEGYALDDGLYEAGSRPAANSLSIAVAAYRATADPRYLAAADALVDWADPAAQPYINGPIDGDERMMRPWMLNMYLRALADYLEMRDEFGLPDTYDARGAFLAYADWLHTYPWLDLDPIDTGPRAAYPYEWWSDGRADNSEPSINNWLLLGADAMAYAHHLSGNTDYLEWAARLFRTGSRDPWFEGDLNFYAESKETVNSITFGHLFLHEWAK
jgi:hypothetical protein